MAIDPSDDMDWQVYRDPDTDGYYEQQIIHAEEGAGVIAWAIALALVGYGLVSLFG